MPAQSFWEFQLGGRFAGAPGCPRVSGRSGTWSDLLLIVSSPRKTIAVVCLLSCVQLFVKAYRYKDEVTILQLGT